MCGARATAWVLVLALLWAQGMGLWHRIAHDPRAPVAVGTPATSTAVATFGHDADDLASCQVFDHLALADLLSIATPAPALDVAAETFALAVVDGIAKARPGHYLARGPPAA